MAIFLAIAVCQALLPTPLPLRSPPFTALRASRISLALETEGGSVFEGVNLDYEAINKAQESLDKKREEEAAADAAAAWLELESAVPASSDAAAPVLTLYRDTNGWCPFCERVWLQLLVKGVPFREELIDLRDKPEWYKEMVPTTLVPAVKYDADEKVTWESVDVMRELEERFPDSPPLLPPDGTPERAHAEAMMESCSALLSSGVRMSYPNASATDEERAEATRAFETELTKLNDAVAKGGGPFMAGKEFSLVDCMYIPMMERWAVQLPITTGMTIRGGDSNTYPALTEWFDAIESVDLLPAYAQTVQGDAYSWSALVGTFQRMFSGNMTDPDKLAKAKQTILSADKQAASVLGKLRESSLFEHHEKADRYAAARKLLSNRENVLTDLVLSEPKSQTNLRRLPLDDRPIVEKGLREVCRRLLDIPDAGEAWAESAADAAIVAQGCKYVARRICAPRDMGAKAASAMRAALLQVAAEAEMYAWKSSGGLL